MHTSILFLDEVTIVREENASIVNTAGKDLCILLLEAEDS
jgi:hypothetical protein